MDSSISGQLGYIQSRVQTSQRCSESLSRAGVRVGEEQLWYFDALSCKKGRNNSIYLLVPSTDKYKAEITACLLFPRNTLGRKYKRMSKTGRRWQG